MGITQSEIVYVFLYDPHTWFGEKNIELTGDKKTYLLNVIDLSLRPKKSSYILIADEYSMSNLPFFFPRSRRVSLLKENPSHTRTFDTAILRKRYDLVLTHREDLIQSGPPFYRVDFSSNWTIRDPISLNNIRKTKLASFIGSINHPRKGGHAFRQDVAKILLKRDDIECFGKGIKTIEYKTEGLVSYCFSVAMENSRENFYYTEKIIDCFFTDTVPIYWGCPGIDGIFDDRGILTFESIAELILILDGLTLEKYWEMLPYVRANKLRCIDLGLDSFNNYLLRCAKAVEAHLPYPNNILKSWQISKPMAGVRMCMERFLPQITFPW